MRNQSIWHAVTLALFAVFVADGARAQMCGSRACTGEEVCWEGDGTLEWAVECGYFHSSDVPLPPLEATVENWGGLPVGTPVHVKGCLSDAPFSICSIDGIVRHIGGNTIRPLAEPCGLTTCTGEEVCWEGTGTLEWGVECGLFRSDDSFFPMPPILRNATVENWGGLPVGTPVRVKGCLSLTSYSFCTAELHIGENTIEALAQPVPSIGTAGLVALALLVLTFGTTWPWLRRRAR